MNVLDPDFLFHPSKMYDKYESFFSAGRCSVSRLRWLGTGYIVSAYLEDATMVDATPTLR